MAALTQGRNTPYRLPGHSAAPAAAGVTIHKGALVMRRADGHAVEGRAAAGLVGIGVAVANTRNADGDGAVTVTYQAGTARFEMATGADAITIAQIGDLCWAIDDQTVAATDGGGSRSPAGIVADVDDLGVWVRLDEALTKFAAA